MSYLTDTEKRLLFSALSREKEVCKKVDKECCREPYEQSLESVVKSLKRKFYYDRFEKEIRAKAIEEFASKMKWEYENSTGVPKKEIEFAKAVIDMVAEQMKGGVVNG